MYLVAPVSCVPDPGGIAAQQDWHILGRHCLAAVVGGAEPQTSCPQPRGVPVHLAPAFRTGTHLGMTHFEFHVNSD